MLNTTRAIAETIWTTATLESFHTVMTKKPENSEEMLSDSARSSTDKDREFVASSPKTSTGLTSKHHSFSETKTKMTRKKKRTSPSNR